MTRVRSAGALISLLACLSCVPLGRIASLSRIEEELDRRIRRASSRMALDQWSVSPSGTWVAYTVWLARGLVDYRALPVKLHVYDVRRRRTVFHLTAGSWAWAVDTDVLWYTNRAGLAVSLDLRSGHRTVATSALRATADGHGFGQIAGLDATTAVIEAYREGESFPSALCLAATTRRDDPPQCALLQAGESVLYLTGTAGGFFAFSSVNEVSLEPVVISVWEAKAMRPVQEMRLPPHHRVVGLAPGHRKGAVLIVAVQDGHPYPVFFLARPTQPLVRVSLDGSPCGLRDLEGITPNLVIRRSRWGWDMLLVSGPENLPRQLFLHVSGRLTCGTSLG